MATGRLGTPRDMTAGTYTEAYTCPTSTFAVVTVSICNRSASGRDIRVALTTTSPPSAPSNAEFLEYDAELVANGVLERTGIVMAANQILSVYSSGTDVSVVVYGIETATA